MLVAFWNACRSQECVRSLLELAIAAGNSPVRTVAGRFPAGSLAFWTNFRRHLYSHAFSNVNVHQRSEFAQVQNLEHLCTCCGDVGALVDDRGKPAALVKPRANTSGLIYRGLFGAKRFRSTPCSCWLRLEPFARTPELQAAKHAAGDG